MAQNRPPPGSMVYWRFNGVNHWSFGYCTYAGSYNMLRMGRWAGDTIGGIIVDVADIEWKEYRR